MMLLFNFVLVMHWFDYSQWYHYLKSESVFKVAVLYNVMRLLERFCSSVEQEMLDYNNQQSNAIIVHSCATAVFTCMLFVGGDC